MHVKPTILVFAVLGAFCAGTFAPSLLGMITTSAYAESAPLSADIIDLGALKFSDLPGTSFPELHAKPLVSTDNATIAIQSGNIAKHMHLKTDEIQYIIEGSGTVWLGNERREFKPGSFIIIPKGTAHAGVVVANGPVKSIAIKIPPQPKDDVVFLN
ncbi:cupin domain-containing protein [Rugamonas apoptosis]|uniref:Cupin domain-containing protein n=1 Tax=Rugamonas apoptosis TaxID=2758570 RepID=A0A7W2IIW5_9BURK|nr:cupin domain-containing protein [Rugamonas apoptosis]MBA5686130.1 cupin domain-containing protein [Rugamonas apoptosis]